MPPARYTVRVSGLPLNMKPLVLSIRRQPFDGADWIFEPKYDGYRGLLSVEPGRAALVSRNGLTFARFDRLAASIASELKAAAAVLDGEVIACDGNGRPVFLDLLRAKVPPCYVAFDLLWLDGEDLRELPLVERKRRLRRILPKRSGVIAESIALESEGRKLFAAVVENDLEGIVAKRKADGYRRGVRWWKIKNPDYTQAKGRGELLNRKRGSQKEKAAAAIQRP